MPYDLTSSASIKSVAKQLANLLVDTRLESQGPEWTNHNFTRLEKFFEKDAGVTCYYNSAKDSVDSRREFVWDFLAIKSNGGILLAAESEQHHKEGIGFRHDFEKLLYVFSPIRLYITKAKTKEEAELLSHSLADYARGCCAHFNPGSVFILHFDLWNDSGSVTYLWQSKGEPVALESEEISFGEPVSST